MNNLDIIILICIVYIIYLLATSGKGILKKANKKVEPTYKEHFTEESGPKYVDKTIKKIKKHRKCFPDDDHFLNPYFVDVQFHNDFRDVITAFNNVAPRQRQIFNLSNIPLKFSIITPEEKEQEQEVYRIMKNFIEVVNQNIKLQVLDTRLPSSGWDEATPDPNVKSGWEKVQEQLGLAPSLYNKPAGKGQIKLLIIDKIEKYETDDEVKYACYLILKKENVEDQMVVKVSVVLDKRALRDERTFLDKINPELPVVIEEIYVLGYLSLEGMDGSEAPRDDLYNFDGLENSEMLDQRIIINELMKKNTQRTKEMQQRVDMLDENGQTFHSTLPSLADYDAYKATKTIFDKNFTLNQ